MYDFSEQCNPQGIIHHTLKIKTQHPECQFLPIYYFSHLSLFLCGQTMCLSTEKFVLVFNIRFYFYVSFFLILSYHLIIKKYTKNYVNYLLFIHLFVCYKLFMNEYNSYFPAHYFSNIIKQPCN